MAIAITLHVISAVVWVGGMFFAYTALRPAAGSLLEPPLRLQLWTRVFNRFFPWVWASILILLATGYWIIFFSLGGMKGAGLHVHLMQGVGLLMMLLYLHVFFGPYRRLKQLVASEDWKAGGEKLAQIRRIVGINTILGIAVIAMGAGGRYL